MERYLTESEQRRLLDYFKASPQNDVLRQRDGAVVRALLHSGCRIGEFCRVSLGDALAALKSGYLFIPRAHRKGGRRDHSVFVTDALREALRALLRVRFDLVGETAHEEDPLVVGRAGQGLSVRGFQLRFKAHALACALPERASPHWLRHTRAMNIMRRSTARDPRGVAQRALGHADIRSTGLYTETAREEVEAALAEVDARPGRVTTAMLRRAYEGRP